jgi:toxin ParE1/3/4
MAYEVVWSPEALEDLDSIAAYIARDSGFYAGAVVAKILDFGLLLAEFPYAGRVVPEVGDETLRERFVYSYRVIYRVMLDRILVVAVIHGRRLLDSVEDRLG